MTTSTGADDEAASAAVDEPGGGASAVGTEASAPARLLRAGALGLLVGGPLSLVFHVLWQIGHGPTVVNEHGVVLGLTNDQWSHLAWIWMTLVAVGVVAVPSLYAGRLSKAALLLTVVGLVLTAASSWLWAAYSLGALVLYAGVLSLGLLILRGRILPRWAGVPLLVAVAVFVPVTVAPDAVLAAETRILGLLVQGPDVVAVTLALAWTALGVALTRLPSGRKAGPRGGLPA